MKIKEIENCTFIINPINNKIFRKSKDKTCFYQVSPRSKKENNFIINFDPIILKQFIPINSNNAHKIINNQFKTLREEWVYNGEKYRNCAPFGSKGVPFTVFEKLPSNLLSYCIKTVYYHGEIFLVRWNGQYDFRCELLNKNLKTIGWTDIRNCSPIVNDLGKYI